MTPRANLGSIVRLVFAFAIAAFLLTGCGSSTTKNASKGVSKHGITNWRAKDCQPAGSHGSSSYLLCRRTVGNQHGSFLSVEGGKKTTLPLTPPGPTPSSKYAGRDGHWYWAALSPDGSRFLAQWSGDCEVPTAFFVSLGGGTPIPVTGERDWLKSPNTMAYGWTTDGRAIVFIPTKPACGTGVFHPGIYLITGACRLKLIWAGKEPPAKLERSLEPRTVQRLKAILGPGAP
jgi:hypothetical protein